jgi:hypothetical protein
MTQYRPGEMFVRALERAGYMIEEGQVPVTQKLKLNQGRYFKRQRIFSSHAPGAMQT